MSESDHIEDCRQSGGIDADLQHRLTQQTIMRSLRPVDLSGKATVRPSQQQTAGTSEGETVIQATKEPDDISERATVAPSRREEPDLSVSDAQTMDTPARKGEATVDEEWDPWRVALPRHMGNWQELTLLPLPDDPDGVIGAGGQATIYSYVQRELGRGVAVKALRPEGRNYEAIEDLVREACVTARLEHPNIVPVHYLHLPEHDQDAPYWVMKRIHGKALTAHLPRGEDPWPIDKLLDVFRRTLDAVAFAHSRGIVHRDLKPDNVLVGAFGEVQVTDWGLAVAVNEEGARGAAPLLQEDMTDEDRRPTSSPSRREGNHPLSEEIAKLNSDVRSGSIGALLKTSSGGRAGTPAYMAPEQLEWTADDIDERTDVFLLGGILYAMLTGSPPHDLSTFTSAEDMFDAIRNCSTLMPPNKRREAKGWDACPEGLSPIAAQGLSTITTKALSRDPDERHPSVEALTEALDKWEAESASADLTAETQDRLDETRSSRRPSARAYAEVIALADAALERLETNVQAQQVRERASAALAAIQQRSARRLWSAVAATLLVFVVGGIGYWRTQRQRDRAEAQREKAEHLASSEAQQRKRANIERDNALREMYYASIALADQKTRDMRFDQAERLLDQCPLALRSWEWGRLKRLCHLELLTLKAHRDHVCCLVFTPDGKRIVSGSRDGTMKIWCADDGHEVMTIQGHDDGVLSLSLSPDGKHVASGGRDKTIKVWDLATGQGLMTLVGHSHHVWSVAFSPDGGQIASGSADKTVKLWDVETGSEVVTLVGHSREVMSVRFSPNGRRVASGSADGTGRVWDVQTGREIMALDRHSLRVCSVVFSPDGEQIASGSMNGTVRIWEARSGREIKRLKGPNGWIWSVAFSCDGRRIVSGVGSTVVVWDVGTGRQVMKMNGHSSFIRSVVFSPDGERIASGGADSAVKVWDAEVDREVVALNGHKKWVESVAFSPCGRWVASGSSDETVKLWDVATGREVMTLAGHGGKVWSVAFSPDGERIASGSSDNTVKIWSAKAGREVVTLAGHGDEVWAVAFDRCGEWIASGSSDKGVKLWNADSGSCVKTLKGHTEAVRSVAFSQLGNRVASGSYDGSVKVWDATTGRELITLKGKDRCVMCVAFSPDGSRLASGRNDGAVKVSDAVTGEEVATLSGHTGPVFSAAFSPDGKRLASASRDTTVKIWALDGGREVLTLTGHHAGVRSVAFGPGGSRIVSAGIRMKIWDSRPAVSASQLVASSSEGEAEGLHYLALLQERKGKDDRARGLHERAAAVTVPDQKEWADKSRWRLESMPWLKP